MNAASATKLYLILLVFIVPSCLWALKFEIPKELREEVAEQKAAEAAELEAEYEALQSGEADAAETTEATMEFVVEAPADEAEAVDTAPAAVESVEAAPAEAAPEEAAVVGRIAGQVFDKETGQPLRGVAIVVADTDFGTITDSQGRYRLSGIPVGNYTLSFIKSGFIEANITDTVVVAGELKRLDFAMPPRPMDMSDEVYELQDFTVSADEANDMMAKLDLKMSSAQALDVFSKDDFSKFAASDVADAIKKIAGVSVTDGKFPSVRGLNDRYVATTLNGMPVPSPDPFRKSPQFDLFPSAVLETVVVAKSSDPSLSGESTAANFDIITIRKPETAFLDFSFGTGFHSGALEEFRALQSSSGGSKLTVNNVDAFAPSPRSSPLNASADWGLEESDYTSNRVVSSESKYANPNSSFSISMGDTLSFGSGRKLSYVFSTFHQVSRSAILDGEERRNYSHTEFTQAIDTGETGTIFGTIQVPIIANFTVPYGDELRYQFKQYKEQVRLGGLVGLNYELSEDHEFDGILFTSRNGDSVVTLNSLGQRPVGRGGDGEQILFNDQDPESGYFTTRESLYYVERVLSLGQFGGSHSFSDFFGAPRLSWRYQKSLAEQEEPDYRDTVAVERQSGFPDENYPQGISNDRSYVLPGTVDIGNSFHSWRDVLEKEDSYRVDLETQMPKFFKGLSGEVSHPLRLGYLSRRAKRDSAFQTYISESDPSGSTAFDPDKPDNTNSQPWVPFSKLEGTLFAFRGTSGAEREIEASYLSMDLNPIKRLNITFGGRFEKSLISVNSDVALPETTTLTGIFRNMDLANPAIPSQAILDEEAKLFGVPEGFANNFTSQDSLITNLSENVFLPSATMRLDLIDGLQLKLGYYETINRPSFREITGDIFIDTETGDLLAGNPFLVSSYTKNYDMRLEYYPGESGGTIFGNLFSENDMFGVSVFKKDIEDPIEFIAPFTDRIDEMPFNNSEGAQSKGIEFEFLKSLKFIPLEITNYLALGGNLAFTDATAGVSESERNKLAVNDYNVEEAAIESRRPLVEQPDTIVNLNAIFEQPDWGVRIVLAYNWKSEVLETVGNSTTFDSWRGATSGLDLTFRKEFKNGLSVNFAAKNILDQGYETFYRNRAPVAYVDAISGTYDLYPSVTFPYSEEEYYGDKIRRKVSSKGISYSLSMKYSF